MKMNGKAVMLMRRLQSIALRRLAFFPFSLIYVLLSGVYRVIQLRRGYERVCVGEVPTAIETLPCSVMLWLDRISAGLVEPRYDVCLSLPREAADANLHDVFSILLTSPSLRSVGLYWDSSSLADDLPLWQGKRDCCEPMVWSTLCDNVGSLSFKRLQEFFQDGHTDIVLPVAATRDAQTLLKRQARGAYAVCLNVPLEHQSLVPAVVAALPDVRFFDLAPYTSLPASGATNNQSLYGYGLSLHERLALVRAADAYVGNFDELGSAALVFRRPAVLLGGGAYEQPDRISCGEISLWSTAPAATPELTKAVLKFLFRQLESASTQTGLELIDNGT